MQLSFMEFWYQRSLHTLNIGHGSLIKWGYIMLMHELWMYKISMCISFKIITVTYYLEFYNAMTIYYKTSRPLHTRAKSHDHEIVRAQKKVSKGCPNTPPKSCSVVSDPQV